MTKIVQAKCGMHRVDMVQTHEQTPHSARDAGCSVVMTARQRRTAWSVPPCHRLLSGAGEAAVARNGGGCRVLAAAGLEHASAPEHVWHVAGPTRSQGAPRGSAVIGMVSLPQAMRAQASTSCWATQPHIHTAIARNPSPRPNRAFTLHERVYVSLNVACGCVWALTGFGAPQYDGD